jgi:hypothetical protein
VNILSSSIKRILSAHSQHSHRSPVTLLQFGTLLGAPLMGMSLAFADDVPCTNPAQGNGTQTCVAHLTGTTPPNQTTWDAHGNGHSGGAGGTTGTLDFSLTSAAQLSDYVQKGTVYTIFSPLDIGTIGGSGGDAYHANPLKPDTTGGTGGAGAQAADVNVTVGSAVSGVSSGSYGANALSIFSQGGAGGGSGKGPNDDGTDGAAGTGGNAGAISGTIDGNWQVTSPAGPARSVFISSQGGAGGFGANYETGLNAQGADAAAAGNGGNVTISLLNSSGGSNQFSGPGGVLIQSVGGTGGLGGDAEQFDGTQGGTGGKGGTAGNVSVTVGPQVSITEANDNDAGLHALSQGGTGGTGGSNGGSGGTAGAGNAAGNVSVAFQGGSIIATGAYSPGVLAQSLGGNGGDGGSASKFVVGPNGGAGSIGGTAGTVSVTGSGINIVTGQYVDPTKFEGSSGVLAQSIGGGGGSGSAASGWFAVGGDGGNAVAGNSATVDLQSNIQTYGFNADGIAVQSIGGGGGKGGDATGTGVGLNMIVGGTGGAGGDGSTAELTSEAGSVINTAGAHASGLVVQSIGGGGGDGGSAYSKSDSITFSASISVGGDGGVGGNAGSVGFAPGKTTTNAGQVSTLGSDSFGILGQAIGGGGGVGGASTAKAYSYGLDDYPNIALSAAIGGNGGSAGAGGSVQIGNAGLVTTSGAGASGMLAQSIGGGGGVAGDASASSTASGGEYSLAASFAFGGKGGSGGNGNTASVANTGLVVTLGESADGVAAQSIGGGGGDGGAGDAKSKSTADTSLSTNITMGGSGGSGGDGGNVTATNSAATIITLGDGSIGLMAQSIGGGGGRAGGAAGSTSGSGASGPTTGAAGSSSGGGSFTGSVNIGGNGGAGGSAQAALVTANNTAGSVILTYGADATGILAQSVGGGGGTAGKSASNLGTKTSTGDGGNSGVNAQTTLGDLAKDFNANPQGTINGYTNLSGAIGLANALLGNTTLPSAFGDDDPVDELDDTAQSRGKSQDDNQSTKITLNVAVGGTGGSGGDGGTVNVNNAGAVATMGDDSDGLIAQSIGGGGGKGGASSTAFSNGDSGTITLGGAWDAKAPAGGGNGGQAVVVNTGSITTAGVLAQGIIAQSIAGGGGIDGVSATSISSNSKNSGNTSAGDGAFSKLLLSIGADGVPPPAKGEVNDASAQVYVTSSGAIQTLGHDSSGIVAQSIAGGGGIEKTIATDLEGGGGSTSSKETQYNINLTMGGAQGVGASLSGLVDVTTQSGGTITTSGDDSYGILAQSIAGGGGLVLGGTPVGTSGKDFFGSGKMTGSVNDDGGGNSGLFVTVGDNITTSGKGSIGVLAQSIGGGGGLAGDTGANETYTTFGSGTSHSGNGGYIGVTVNQDATVSTSGDNAPAMFLQSIGGGGGRITNASGAYIGTAGGSGQGGSINVAVNGTVQATGAGSGGIFAQSEGDSTSNSPINITIGNGGTIVVGKNDVATGANGTSAAIYIDHGGKDAADANTVTNNGLVQTYGSGTNAVAVYNNAGYTSVINNGTMAGDVLLTNGGGNGCFTNNGTFNAGDSVMVGNCPLVNTGTINVGGPGVIGKTTISGDYVQKAGGSLVVDANFATGKSDVLTIDGAATIAGTIDVQATSLRKTTLEVVSATGPLTLEPTVQASATHLYSYQVEQVGNTLEVTPQAHFAEQAAGFGHPEQAVANSLQSIFDSGATLNGFSTLQKINGNADYASSLHSIAGEGLGAFGAFRINSSRSFTFDLYGGCREMTSDQKVGDSCTWARVFDRSTDQDARNDTVGYHADAYTLEVGGQVSLSENLALVVAAGSENSTLQDDARDSQINGSTAIAGTSLNYANGPVELSGAVDGAYGSYRSTRTITVAEDAATANAAPRQWQIGAHLRAAYSVPMSSETYYVKPFVDGHAIFVSNDAFTESGTSPFNLAVEGRSDTALLGGVGTEFGAHYRTSSGTVFHPFVSVAAEFDSAMDWTTTAHFADQPAGAPFSVRTAGPGTLGRLAVGGDVVNSTHWSFSLMYDPDVGHGYTSQAGSARVSYRF